MDSTVNKRVNIYCCGGLGINLGQRIQSPYVDVVYLDSSKANIADNIDPEKRVYIEGVKGSGSVRQHNYRVIAREIPRFLEHFTPAEFNIVLFSASGGY